MAEISAGLVKDLREKTGVGMMDCKKALAETAGDIEAAVDWLRAKGLSKAAKKADRAAAEGLVGIEVAGNKAAAIEFNSETDFVARNEQFQRAAAALAKIGLEKNGDRDAILAAPSPDGDGAVSDMITRLIATIGENMTMRRSAALSVGKGAIGSYVHSAIAPGLGRIGVLVAIESEATGDELDAFAKKLAQHIAAAGPIALSEADMPADRMERERAVAIEQVKEDPKLAGKPQNVIDGAVNGKVRKVLEELVLLKQKFIHDDKTTVEQAVQNAAKSVGKPVAITRFVRFALGEGVEKKADDFAAEVAAMGGR
ncbi:MAG TPA: translation elongation factor Ts [Caulobacterales bacterium]|nr:translation elongation factor Ts [Caulobacterales bacterium]